MQIDVTADAFCHSMVRALVGSLITVGELRMPIERPAALQAAGMRTSEIHVAPAHGLTLLAVDYPPDAELAARAETARARREPGHADQVIVHPIRGSTVRRAGAGDGQRTRVGCR